mmetsp:Transcript_38502/g.60072  ORF Transcript_38502/g.60072 Transcript_38502/m.60072 type:complete len:85 (+) Transcript_38502:76-330(+)
MVRPLSGLQKQVLGLFREALRLARTKDASMKEQITQIAREEFKKHQKLPKSDVERIEYLIRRGRKQLDRVRSSNVGFVSTVDKR